MQEDDKTTGELTQLQSDQVITRQVGDATNTITIKGAKPDEDATEKPSAVRVKITRVHRLPFDVWVSGDKVVSEDAEGAVLVGRAGDEISATDGRKYDVITTRLPYEDGTTYQHWNFAADEDAFIVPVIVADAAVASGFFRAGE